MSKPLISILMPTCNCEKTVAQALRSVIYQTFQDWEMLVIDDGSTDGSLVEIRRSQDVRIRILEYGQNAGLATRLNEGIERATGEFIARMDADDVCYPDRLELQLKFLRSHPEVDLVGGGILAFDSDGRVYGKWTPPVSHEGICRRPYRGFPIAHPTWFGKIQWFRHHQYSEDCLLSQDQDLLLRAFRSSCFANLPTVVLGYRQCNTMSKRLQRRRFWMRVILAEYCRNRQLSTGCLGVGLTLAKGTFDCAATLVGLKAFVIRHRYEAITSVERAAWVNVSQTLNDPRSAIGDKQALLQAPPQHEGAETHQGVSTDLPFQAITITRRPLVTIAMSVRNCGQTVALAARSVLNQTFQDWELLVIDDGSTDATLAEVRRFQDDRVRVLHDGHSKGLPARLNEAIGLAKGEYLARMDGDDVCYPERLELQLKYLRSHPEVDLVAGGVLVFHGDGQVAGKRIPPEEHQAICRRPYAGFPMAHPTYCGKTRWFRRYGYSEAAVRCEDQDLLLRAWRLSCYANLSAIVLGYREQLDLGKLLRSRRFFARMVLAEYVRKGQAAIGLRGVLEQLCKGTIDTLAVLSCVNYSVLRHRANLACSADLSRWQQVWQSANQPH